MRGKKSGADFDYVVTKIDNRNCIAIVDLDMGHVSVTNSIEHVIKDIKDLERIPIVTDWIIVYRDSEGIWDGWDARYGTFFPLRETEPERAILKYISKKKQ